MKPDSKTATIRPTFVLFAALFFLSACSADLLPTWISGEPDEAVLNAPRAVTRAPAGADRPWPNLADVPESKPSVLSQDKAAGLTRRLVQDRQEAQSEAERISHMDLGAVHKADDPVTELEGEPYPVGILTAPDQDRAQQVKPFSALRP